MTDYNKFLVAGVNGNLTEVKKNFSIEYANAIDKYDELTPLMRAVVHDHLHIIEFLLDKVNVNIINEDGFTALLLATIRLTYNIDSRKVIWTLFKSTSIDINICNNINSFSHFNETTNCTFLDILLRHTPFDCYDIIKYSIVNLNAKINNDNKIHTSMLINIVKKKIVKEIKKYLLKDFVNIILEYAPIDNYNDLVNLISL